MTYEETRRRRTVWSRCRKRSWGSGERVRHSGPRSRHSDTKRGPRSHLTMVLGLVTVIQRYRTELNQSVERDLADVSTGRQLLLVTPTQTHTSFKPWRSGHISWHGAASTSMVYEFARISFHSEMKMCSPKCRQIWNSKLTLHEKIKSSQFSKKNYI